MHPLLRIAFVFCPREYRLRYSRSIASDTASREIGPFTIALDVFRQGVSMHVESFAREIALAIRRLSKSPLHATVVVAAIALALGANVAAGSVLEGVLLRPLPYAQPQRLFVVGETPTGSNLSYPEARDIAARSRSLAGIALMTESNRTLAGFGAPVNVGGAVVNGEFFRILGVHPELGRLLDEGDQGTANIVVSHAFRRKYLSANAQVLGARLRLNDREYTVVGVMPPDFYGPFMRSANYWSPLNPRDRLVQARGDYFFTGVARLRPGIRVASARADLNRVLLSLYRRYPRNHAARFHGGSLTPLLDRIVGPIRMQLWLIFAAVALVLLVACANVANLNVLRAASRERELLLRSALGAGIGRIVGEVCTEVGLLALCAGVVGIALAWAALRTLDAYGSATLPRWQDVGIHGSIVGYAILLVALLTLLTGALPALLHRRVPAARLRGIGNAQSHPGARRLRSVLIVAEIALAVALVISSGLQLRSFVALTRVPLGFDSQRLYDVQFGGLPGSRYPTVQSQVLFTTRALRELRAIPGVTSASMGWNVPFDGFGGLTTGLKLPGRPDPHDIVGVDAVPPGFFRMMGIPLLFGRDVAPQDRTTARPVAIVNERFALKFFGTPNVVGRRIQPGICMTCSAAGPPIVTVVGVVGDARSSRAEEPVPVVFFPFAQLPNVNDFVVRTQRNDAAVGNAVAAAFRRIDPRLPAPDVYSYATLLAQDGLQARADAWLFSVLAAIALLLALAGVYAVTAYSTQERTNEFGVRRALGAQTGNVLRDAAADALALSAIGIAAGLALAAVFAKPLSAILFQVSPFDAPTFLGVTLLAIACTVLAALVPALRATRVQPATALRYE